MTQYAATLDSPIGAFTVIVDDDGKIVRAHFGEDELPDDLVRDDARCAAAVAQLREYFAGSRRDFDLALELHGTDFQRAVWEELCRIPYGATISYGELARRIGKPSAIRAVGAANGANPIPVIVPCHRVIGSNGTLTGYGGGLHRKERLLEIEGVGRKLF